MATSKPDSVREFLLEFKRAASKRELSIADRKKNNDFLQQCGISIDEQDEIILALTVENYVSGPEPDRDARDSTPCVWIFGVEDFQNAFDIYIKVKMVKDQFGDSHAKLLGFHQPERQMRFPYRK